MNSIRVWLHKHYKVCKAAFSIVPKINSTLRTIIFLCVLILPPSFASQIASSNSLVLFLKNLLSWPIWFIILAVGAFVLMMEHAIELDDVLYSRKEEGVKGKSKYRSWQGELDNKIKKADEMWKSTNPAFIEYEKLYRETEKFFRWTMKKGEEEQIRFRSTIASLQNAKGSPQNLKVALFRYGEYMTKRRDIISPLELSDFDLEDLKEAQL